MFAPFASGQKYESLQKIFPPVQTSAPDTWAESTTSSKNKFFGNNPKCA
jgi:hypothetical protein